MCASRCRRALCLNVHRGACTARDAALRTGLAHRRQVPDAAITGGEGSPATRWIEIVIVVRAPHDEAPSVPAHLRGVLSHLFDHVGNTTKRSFQPC